MKNYYYKYYILGLDPKGMIDSGLAGNIEALKQIIVNRLTVCHSNGHNFFKIVYRSFNFNGDGFEQINGEINDIYINLSTTQTDQDIKILIDSKIL